MDKRSIWQFEGVRLWALLGIVFLAGCGDKTPIPLGFMGGVSGRVADLGIAGRNGVLLAVEDANARGGVRGRKVDLLVRDDEQSPDLAKRRFLELADAKVVALIGPMTSGMAATVLPLANERKLLTVSPTATANDLGGKDDFFFRVISPTREYASVSARHQRELLNMARVAMIFDLRNKAYSESWGKDFHDTFTQLGGTVVFSQGFQSGDDAGLAGLVELALRNKPDGVILVANSVDAALLVQQVRQRAPTMKVATAEWSATERFIELAGRASEGVVTAQFVDRESGNPDFQSFRKRFKDRFGDEPGFAGVAAYDAAHVVLTALEDGSDTSIRDKILARKKFNGLQGAFEFDAYGDAARNVYLTEVRDGKFIVIPRDGTKK